MARTVCPHWIGYVLLNPLRKLFESPEKLLGPHIREDMTVLEPGCGMGYFTLPAARMVGSGGRIIALDIQEKMILSLKKRAEKAGLLDRMDLRVVTPENMHLDDLHARVDLVIAFHMVHEVPDEKRFFHDMATVLKPGGRLFLMEPKGHVTREHFEDSIHTALASGLTGDPEGRPGKERRMLFCKQPS